MRIERLPQENPRMQGAERRAWYRRHSAQHLAAVATLVDTALTRCGGSAARAVVLGAGACTEVPLERLARACGSVLLVDVDLPGMMRAQNELPASLRGRVRTLAADVTGGVSGQLQHELRAQPWADLVALGGAAGTAPLDAAATCLQRCTVPDPPVIAGLTAGSYDLVMSSLLLTQLFSLPLLDLVDTLTFGAPGVVDQREAHIGYQQAANNFRRRIALAHLSLLGALLAPKGAGLLVSDVTGYLVPPRAGQHAAPARAAEALGVLPPTVLALPDDVAARFALAAPLQRWQWVAQEADAARPGRVYDVCGLVFAHATA